MGEPGKKNTVLIAEDEELIRTAFCLLVQSLEGVELVGEAENGAMAVELAARLQPAIVLMDLDMPVMGGIEANKRIREVSPATRVIALTGLREPSGIVRGVREGMDGFLLKRTSQAELKLALEAVARGERYLSPEVASIVAREYVEDLRKKESPLVGLTVRESQIVEMLASGQRSKQIAETLGISDKTVDKHCENARGKLKATTTAELVGAWLRLERKEVKSG